MAGTWIGNDAPLEHFLKYSLVPYSQDPGLFMKGVRMWGKGFLVDIILRESGWHLENLNIDDFDSLGRPWK